MDKRISYISKQVGSNLTAEYTIEDLAKMANLSEPYLHRLFKAETGKTPMEFIRDIRLEKLRDLLLNTFMLCKEICAAVGFSDPVIFSRIFKKKYGITPQVFRETRD